MSAATQYATCMNCDATFATQEEARAHGQATMTPTGEHPVTARGHGWTVINPTPEEVVRNRVRSAVEWAMEKVFEDFIDDMESDTKRGDFTADELRKELTYYPDFATAWAEYEEEA